MELFRDFCGISMGFLWEFMLSCGDFADLYAVNKVVPQPTSRGYSPCQTNSKSPPRCRISTPSQTARKFAFPSSAVSTGFPPQPPGAASKRAAFLPLASFRRAARPGTLASCARQRHWANNEPHRQRAHHAPLFSGAVCAVRTIQSRLEIE